MLRKLWAGIKNALVWAVAWVGWGTVWLGVTWALGSPVESSAIGGWLLAFAANGFISGAVFSLLLGSAYRRSALSDLNGGRMALWGAAFGLLPIAVITATVVAVGMLDGSWIVRLSSEFYVSIAIAFGLPGATTAVATIKIAQSAPDALSPYKQDSLPAVPDQ